MATNRFTAVFLLLCYLLVEQALAQIPNGFSLLGTARITATPDCIELTQAGNSSVGVVWFDKRLDLSKSFELSFVLNFGDDPYGADGIAMVMQNKDNRMMGTSGNGMGYKGLIPTFGIEFDTNYNSENGDLLQDHMALFRNGACDHRQNTGMPLPVPILTSLATVKDGRDCLVKVYWDAPTQRLRVEVNCQVRISHTIDLVNTIFGGEAEVIWGFTSATGSASSNHTVCFPRQKRLLDTLQACRGDQLTLTAPPSANGPYQWMPTTDLATPQAKTTPLKVTTSQLYTVQYADYCNLPKLDSIYVKATTLSLQLGENRTVCAPESVTLTPTITPANVPVTYTWSSGETTAYLSPTSTGQYALTATSDGCSVSNTVMVTINAQPKLSLPPNSTFDCPGKQALRLDPQMNEQGLQYSWSPGGSTAPSLQATAPGLYTVKITTTAGCSAVQHFTILDNCPSERLFVPDAFTPNGDGINDRLMWQSTVTANPLMRIFNAWGELIFESDASTPYWDGTYKGQPCSVGTYAWIIQYRLQNSPEALSKTGRVLLLK